MSSTNENSSELLKQLEAANARIIELENTIREQEALRKSVVDYSLDGTLIVDSNFNVLYSNEEVQKILGYSPQELQGQDFRFFVDRGSIILMENIYQEILEKWSHDSRFECQVRHRDGKLRYVFVSASFMEDFKGKNVIVSQILDITELKAAQERMMKINEELERRVVERTSQLEEAMSELKTEISVRQKTEQELHIAKEELSNALEQEKQLNDLKSRFISMISHEYRTPLTVILTSTYILERLYNPEMAQQFEAIVNKIPSSVKSMTQLLEDVLTIGKSDAGKLQLYISKLDYVHLTYEIIEEVKVIDQNKHEFEFTFSQKQIICDTDERNLRHVLNNLVSNAAKYSPGADKVVVKITDDEQNIYTLVQDFGIGIPKADLEYLFEAFYRGTNVGAISGTGLGLAIVFRSIQALKGDIRVESEEGKGSSFYLTIPKVLTI